MLFFYFCKFRESRCSESRFLLHLQSLCLIALKGEGMLLALTECAYQISGIFTMYWPPDSWCRIISHSMWRLYTQYSTVMGQCKGTSTATWVPVHHGRRHLLHYNLSLALYTDSRITVGQDNYTLLQKKRNFSEPIFPGVLRSLTPTPGHVHFVKWFRE